MNNLTTQDSFEFPRICNVSPQPQAHTPVGFPHLAAEFEEATGWVLSFDESTSLGSPANPFGKVSISDMSSAWPARTPTASRMICDQLAERISLIFQNRQRAIESLCQTKACDSCSQATQWVNHSDAIGQKINQLLDVAYRFAGADSAGICLLDKDSQNLTFRYVIDQADLLGMTRPIRECEADVEALCGSAIVMTDRAALQAWGCPVECNSAVCLPVSSSGKLLGTIWVFGDREQDYNAEMTNLIEIIAGTIACELELESVRFQIASEKTLKKAKQEKASDLEESEPDDSNYKESAKISVSPVSVGPSNSQATLKPQLTLVQPPFAGWSVETCENLGYVNWAVTSDEQVVAVVSDASEMEEHAAITKVLQTVAAGQCDNPTELLKEICQVLGSERGETSLMVAVIDPLIGEVQLSQTGCRTLASLVDCSGVVSCVKCNFACFMTRGQSLSFQCKTGVESSSMVEPQLTFRRS